MSDPRTLISPLLSSHKAELTNAEKMDLTVFAGLPIAKTIFKVMEMAVVEARDDAMAVDPSDTKQQIARLTVAHAMQKFYEKFKGNIMASITEHIADIEMKAIEEDLKDQARIEEIILGQ